MEPGPGLNLKIVRVESVEDYELRYRSLKERLDIVAVDLDNGLREVAARDLEIKDLRERVRLLKTRLLFRRALFCDRCSPSLLLVEPQDNVEAERDRDVYLGRVQVMPALRDELCADS